MFGCVQSGALPNMTNTPTRSHDEGAQEPLPLPGEQAAPAYFNPVVGGQSDTARGRFPSPPDQSPPSRLITLPLEHVKTLLGLATTVRPITDIDRAIIRETRMRVADEAQQ